ncbi:distal tail protein Dit [Vagococcus fluvialis]|uniref:distal tail protein Dit n=1 Tax=Vagococcus fluvialis TaxID=2738 RepID=UPI0028923CA2|nr:distal tail protein Dit [Vagococcus fluvialis]MDT2782926.1 phage tail family protein [Vagococcus fluvialis]
MTISDVVIKFDDLVLSDYFDLLEEPEMGLFAPVNNEVVRTGNSVKLADSHTGANTINLQVFSTKGDWRKLKDDLSLLARDQELHKLWFSHEPDRYYLCKLDGDSRLARSLEYKNEASGVISFIVPDGKSHGVNRDVFTAALNSDGIMEMEVNNEGTETTPLSFTADIKSDNGFLGVVTENGAMEFGKIEEVDGYVDMSEWAFVDHLDKNDGSWYVNTGTIEWKNSNVGNPNLIQGNLAFQGGKVVPTTWGTVPTDNRWYGPTLSKNIPAKTSDGKRTGNWRIRFWLEHKSNGDARKLGRQEFNLSRNNVNSNITFTIYDDVAGANRTIVQFKILGEVKFSFIVNPNFTEFYGSVDIWKERNRIYLKLYSYDTKSTATYSYYDERYGTLEFDKFTYWASRYRNYDICRMSFNYIDFQWIGTQNFVDVPNRYMDGDILTYEGDSGKFYVNDVLSLGDIVQGSTDLKIPPGKHKVQFYYSDFNKVPPVIKGTIRKRWL